MYFRSDDRATDLKGLHYVVPLSLLCGFSSEMSEVDFFGFDLHYFCFVKRGFLELAQYVSLTVCWYWMSVGRRTRASNRPVTFSFLVMFQSRDLRFILPYFIPDSGQIGNLIVKLVQSYFRCNQVGMTKCQFFEPFNFNLECQISVLMQNCMLTFIKFSQFTSWTLLKKKKKKNWNLC